MKTKLLVVAAVLFSAAVFGQACVIDHPCYPSPSGLIAWWTGDDNTNDLVGNHNGTLMNGASYSTGEVCSGFLLDGVDDYVMVPDNPAWAFGTNDFTIDVWANLNVVKFCQYWEPWNTLVAQDESSFDYKKWIFYLTGYTIAFIIDDPMYGPVFMNVNFTPQPHVWYHFAITRSGSTFSFYVNGVLLETRQSGRAILDANYPLTIGWCEMPQNYFNGIIDEVDIFNRALSQQELSDIYNADCVGKCKAITYPVITPDGPLTFPEGGSVTLTASTGNSYLWSTGETTGSIVVTTSGEYYVTVGVEFGCSFQTPPVTVTVTPKPNCDAYPCGNGKVTICHIPPGNPGKPQTLCVSKNALPAHLAHGDYCGPCLKSGTAVDMNTVETTGNHVDLSPNPFNGMTTFSFAFDEDTHLKLSVFDLFGHQLMVLYDGETITGKDYTVDFDGRNLAKGIYIYRAVTYEKVYSGKMLLQ